MASPHSPFTVRAGAALNVALRVPSVFAIDAVLSASLPGEAGPGWVGVVGVLLVRALVVLLSLVVLQLPLKALLQFYTLLLGMVLASASALINYYAVSHSDLQGALLHRAGSSPSVWLALGALQLFFGLGYVCLLRLPSSMSLLVAVDVVTPTWSLVLGLPLQARQAVSVLSGLALVLTTLFCLVERLRWLHKFSRYECMLLRIMVRLYGLQAVLEDTWLRIRLPDVLRLFWITRVTAQALIQLYVNRGEPAGGTHTQLELWSWQDLCDLTSHLIISGCDSTLAVLGMSAVISSLAHYLGLGILAFIGSTEEDDRRLGSVAPILFFILALQTGLSSLDPEERLERLGRNMCLLLTAVLHFVHGMVDPVLMSLSASHVSSLRRHLPVLLVSALLMLLPACLSLLLWRLYHLNTWLFAVTAFCVELCLKVLVSLTVYVLFMVDGCWSSLWEQLDDYVYYVRSSGSVMEFLFGVVMFGNGAYTMMFESGSKIRACMMCLHAYFNIYLQARSGWRTFINRRSAVKKINSLPQLKGAELQHISDVCAICYQEFSAAACTTPCKHYFHALCLRKWLYIQDTCPMCHQRIHLHDTPTVTPPQEREDQQGPGEGEREGERAHREGEEREDGTGRAEEDNDSIEYDSDEWNTRNVAAREEDMDQDQDSDQN
ncbi:unnamed protein product [Knipowitschia caucasica]|uniref:RING-type domain-containing protein n=1 Tax=Knipowitschia caucasica TaxID=637954 RepID=A0AAV2K7S5_KNICA